MSKEPELEKEKEKEPELPPPILGTWNRFYAVVLANTVLVYLLLLLFSAYSR